MEFLSKIDTLKAELNALRPLPLEAMEQLRLFYRVGLTYTSNAIEGSTLTESETKVVLEDGLTVSGKPLRDHLDAVGHATAFDWMWNILTQEIPIPLTETHILKLHQLVVSSQEALLPGQYRNKAVFISGTDYLPPEPGVIPALMTQLYQLEWPQWIQNYHPVEAAALFHWKLVTIHPFLDGNGRVARLAMNLALLKNGYGITHIPLVRRLDYISSLAQSRNESLTPDGATQFITFISEMAYESMKDYLRLVKHLKHNN
jgi:Fic family protein